MKIPLPYILASALLVLTAGAYFYVAQAVYGDVQAAFQEGNAALSSGNIGLGLSKYREYLHKRSTIRFPKAAPPTREEKLAIRDILLLAAKKDLSMQSTRILEFLEDQNVAPDCAQRVQMTNLFFKAAGAAMMKGRADESRDMLYLTHRWLGPCMIPDKYGPGLAYLSKEFEKRLGAPVDLYTKDKPAARGRPSTEAPETRAEPEPQDAPNKAVQNAGLEMKAGAQGKDEAVPAKEKESTSKEKETAPKEPSGPGATAGEQEEPAPKPKTEKEDGPAPGIHAAPEPGPTAAPKAPRKQSLWTRAVNFFKRNSAKKGGPEKEKQKAAVIVDRKDKEPRSEAKTEPAEIPGPADSLSPAPFEPEPAKAAGPETKKPAAKEAPAAEEPAQPLNVKRFMGYIKNTPVQLYEEGVDFPDEKTVRVKYYDYSNVEKLQLAKISDILKGVVRNANPEAKNFERVELEVRSQRGEKIITYRMVMKDVYDVFHRKIDSSTFRKRWEVLE